MVVVMVVGGTGLHGDRARGERGDGHHGNTTAIFTASDGTGCV